MEGAALALSVFALIIAGAAAWYTKRERTRHARREREAQRAKRRRNRWLF